MVRPKTDNNRVIYVYTAEAEYIVLGSATQKLFKAILLNDLKIDTKSSIEIMEDNQSTIAMTKSSVTVRHIRTKHLDIKHRFIREIMRTGKIILSYCPTANT